MAKAIMIQGTMSNAGKSLLCAGLCRIFVQDGYRVAPFKSQNMALNSFITKDGLEMGRAQVTQAECAKIQPSVWMNPILLKPTNDVGSQVIVNGRAIGNMSAKDYFAYKRTLIPQVMQAYEHLAKENDIVVIEGAGSPAEINLKSEDIVNMGLAKMVKAPVLLAGDIDRGGVFASLFGTVSLLEKDEQAYVKGLIINKFRGDVDILRPGLLMLEELIHKPVVGVVPYLHLDIDDEDSLSERFDKPQAPTLVDIAVIRLPHISNFTDFNALSQIPNVGVRYVKAARELGRPDMVILPGTKNTIGDLLWLRQNGLEAAILKLSAQNIPVMGVCGGYQMLGQTLKDPLGLECQGEVKGMGLLPVQTVFEERKVTTRVKARGLVAPFLGAGIDAYEIHMGHTALLGGAAFAKVQNLQTGQTHLDGCVCPNVWGTYLHGLFDSAAMRKALGEYLFAQKGLAMDTTFQTDWESYKQNEYDKLADALRQSLDIQQIYRILWEGMP